MGTLQSKFKSRLCEKAQEIHKKNDYSPARKWMDLYHDVKYLSVDQFARYKNNEYFFNQINVILRGLELDDMDLETGKWSVELEQGDMLFGIEYEEDKIETYVSFYNDETKEETEYHLSEDENGIILDWLNDWLKEYRDHASSFTGDPWKDNGVSKRDFYGI